MLAHGTAQSGHRECMHYCMHTAWAYVGPSGVARTLVHGSSVPAEEVPSNEQWPVGDVASMTLLVVILSDSW